MTDEEVQKVQSDIASQETELELIDQRLDRFLRQKKVVKAAIVLRKAQLAPIRTLQPEILAEMIS